MHPIVRKELMNIRVTELHRRAERERTATALVRAKKPRHISPGQLAAVFVRLALAVMRAHSLRRTLARAGQGPATAPTQLVSDADKP